MRKHSNVWEDSPVFVIMCRSSGAALCTTTYHLPITFSNLICVLYNIKAFFSDNCFKSSSNYLVYLLLLPMNIHLSKTDKVRLLHSKHIYSIMQKILLREDKIAQGKEHFWTLGLAANHQLLFVESIHLNAASTIPVEPIDVYSLALQKGAEKIVLCHNHPNGKLSPSQTDQDITDRLIQVGLIINLPIIDHLIISDTNYLSFEDVGLMKVLKSSIQYVPNYVLAQRIRTEMYELMEQRMEEIRQKATLKILHIANQLKQNGMAVQDIAECTNLSVEEIEKLVV